MPAHPEYLYYAAMAMCLCLMPFNGMAVVVVAVWVVGQLGNLLGFPLPMVHLVADGLGFAVAIGWARGFWGTLVAAVFLPMIWVDAQEATGALHPYYAYWQMYGLAMIQLLILVPFCTDWALVKRVYTLYRLNLTIDRLRSKLTALWAQWA